MRCFFNMLLAAVPILGCGDDAGVGTNSSTSSSTSLPAGDTMVGTDSSPSSGSSSESSSTTGPMPCVSDDECTDAAAPFCGVNGECGTCEGTKKPDDACAGVDPAAPLCVGGACVQCTSENPAACTGTTPLCDGETNTCVPCTAHDQCAGGAACNLYIGACLPADRVFEVGGPAEDFPSLFMAVENLAADTQSTLLVYPGMPDYNEAVTVDQGRVVAFLAAEIAPGVEPPRWVRTSGMESQLTVTAGATVFVDGMQLSSNASAMVPGLRVDGGRVWVDRSRIVQNSGGGVLAENGAELTLRNCFVSSNGNGISAVVSSDANASILYSTMFSSAFAPTAALSCAGTTTLTLRNSIVVTEGGALGNELDCIGGDVSYSATEALVPGEGNVAVGLFPDGSPEQWFADVNAGDLGVQNQGLDLFADVAQWSAGDPITDIDGDPRPVIDGTTDYAGADLPQ